MNIKYNEAENDKNKILGEYTLLDLRIKKMEQDIRNKTEENERLKTRVNELTKNTII